MSFPHSPVTGHAAHARLHLLHRGHRNEHGTVYLDVIDDGVLGQIGAGLGVEPLNERLKNTSRLSILFARRHSFLSPSWVISCIDSSSSDRSVLPPNLSMMLVSNLSCPNTLLHTLRLRTLAISG